MKSKYEVVVIGGGSIGLATANELGKRKASTLVLEKFSFLNQDGSSAGYSRQFRIPYPEEYMVKMAVQAKPFWEALEAETGEKLMDTVGTLWFGDPKVHSTEGNIGEAEKSLQKQGVKYTALSAAEVEKQYHFQGLPPTYTGLFQPDGAIIDLALTLKTLLILNKKHESVTLQENSPVTGIEYKDKVFYITTPHGNYEAEKLVLTPGPYINDVLNLLGFDINVTYWEMSSAYFKKLKPEIQYPTWFVFQNPDGDNGNQFYGFPGVDWDYPGYIRVAPDFVIKPLTDPNQRTGKPNPQELAFTAEWVKKYMEGLSPEPEFTSTCLIALSNIKDKELVLDFAPDYVEGHENIVIYGTGWAAKFIPLLGKIMSQLTLDGSTPYDIAPFQLGYKYFNAIVEQ
jgi:sarcosine oxidase/sarcosine oxidase/L-pipecolate oxidase